MPPMFYTSKPAGIHGNHVNIFIDIVFFSKVDVCCCERESFARIAVNVTGGDLYTGAIGHFTGIYFLCSCIYFSLIF